MEPAVSSACHQGLPPVWTPIAARVTQGQEVVADPVHALPVQPPLGVDLQQPPVGHHPQEEHDQEQHQREPPEGKAQPRQLRGQGQGDDRARQVPRYSCSRLLISALATARAVWSVKCSVVMNCRMLCRSAPAPDSSTITSVNRPGGRCRAEFRDAPTWRIMIGLR
jgi:hypothetical protein